MGPLAELTCLGPEPKRTSGWASCRPPTRAGQVRILTLRGPVSFTLRISDRIEIIGRVDLADAVLSCLRAGLAHGLDDVERRKAVHRPNRLDTHSHDSGVEVDDVARITNLPRPIVRVVLDL